MLRRMPLPPFADLLDRLFVAGVAITTRALNEATPDLRLTFAQWRIVLVIGENPDGATAAELAARVGVTVPTTIRQLRRLARRGLLVINRDEGDPRAIRARLTVRGSSVRDQILGYRVQAIEMVATDLRVSRATVAELERVADSFDVFR